MFFAAHISSVLRAESLPDALGQHWQLDFAECQVALLLLEDASSLQEILRNTLDKADMHIEGQTFHQSSPQQVAGALMLAHGHLNIQTWLSPKLVSVNLYLSADLVDYHTKGEQLCQLLVTLFAPKRYNCQSSPRRFSLP